MPNTQSSRSGRTARRCPAISWIALSVTFAAFLAGTAAAGSRVVAIGDVHGDYDGLVSILEAAGLIDDARQWTGEDTTLVQVGDLTDRGADVRAVLDLMIALQSQAPKHGGQVIALLGNHEVSNLNGIYDYRSTSREVYSEIAAPFVDDGSAKRRRRAYRRWQSWGRRFPVCARQEKTAWMSDHPLGFLEYQEAMAVDGLYGRWLRDLPIAARVEDTIFVHGGLGPGLQRFGIHTLENLNARAREELDRYAIDRATLIDEGIVLPFSTLPETFCALQVELETLRQSHGRHKPVERVADLEAIRDRLPSNDGWLLYSADGPVWFRGYANWSEQEGAALIADVIDTFGAKRLVVGHTPQKTGSIQSRFDARVFLIDTAMVFGAAGGGRPSALEIRSGNVAALYVEPLPAVDPSAEPQPPASPPPSVHPADDLDHLWLDPEGRTLPFDTDDELLDFLRTASIVERRTLGSGTTNPQKLLLEKDGVRAHAIFHDVHVIKTGAQRHNGRSMLHFRDHYLNNVAAYELSRLLGIVGVPPTVVRSVGGVRGSVQAWVEDAMTEAQRRARSLKPPSESQAVQRSWDMWVFDNLINNIDRNQGNMLYDPEWNLWLIDHTRAFSREVRLPDPGRIIRVSRRLWARLHALDEAETRSRLGDLVGRPGVGALFQRREELIALIQDRIDQRGAQSTLFSYRQRVQAGIATVTRGAPRGCPPAWCLSNRLRAAEKRGQTFWLGRWSGQSLGRQRF